MQGQGRLQAQGVARPEAGGDDARAERRRPRSGGGLGGDGALDAVLAGVAGAGDDARSTPRQSNRATRKRPTAAASGATRARPSRACGSLHGDDGPVRGHVVAADGAAHPGGVGGVGHHVEALVVDPPDDDVVERPRRRRRRAGGCTGPGPGRSCRRSLVRVAWRRLEGVGPAEADRAEVADVEGDRVAAGRPGARRRCRPGTTGASPSRRRATIRAPRRAVGGVEGRVAERRHRRSAHSVDAYRARSDRLRRRRRRLSRPGRPVACRGRGSDRLGGRPLARGWPSSVIAGVSSETTPASGTMLSTPWPPLSRSMISSPEWASTERRVVDRPGWPWPGRRRWSAGSRWPAGPACKRHAGVEQPLDHLQLDQVACRSSAAGSRCPGLGDRGAEQVGPGPVVELAVGDADDGADLRAAVAARCRPVARLAVISALLRSRRIRLSSVVTPMVVTPVCCHRAPRKGRRRRRADGSGLEVLRADAVDELPELRHQLVGLGGVLAVSRSCRTTPSASRRASSA